MNRHDITPLILTYNEAPNLQRSLSRLTWASEVVVLDSYSTDETCKIAQGFPNVRFESRAFDDHTQQWNHGVSLCRSRWILSLDADYVLADGFEQELETVTEEPAAYEATFRYWIFGQQLRASLYPPRAVLFDRERCQYVQDGHTQILKIAGGALNRLKTEIYHDDRKPLTRWLSSQDKYAKLEAEKLLSAEKSSLRLQDKLRLSAWAAVPASLVYTLLIKGVIWDGWPGWYYALQRMLAEVFLALRLLEARWQNPPSSQSTAHAKNPPDHPMLSGK
jgi:glycosyltransferase involved in cell wall biosynthesis